ncbi:alpha-ribazole phosphatase CobZ [Methanohalobium sp.]|uniref:alpha-ribazole phosphatase CobZ n=1 Tax=Methanohalobium sp. TaxID=2837493 RepID=UPI0025D47A8A|nr:alpha-ribazole phosphatase CobZ [Methanohalobium sp.]
MKLSDIDEKYLKGEQPEELEEEKYDNEIYNVMEKNGVSKKNIIDTAMELYFSHPGLETKEKAESIFTRELDIAFSDPNLCILVYSGILLEKEGEAGSLPNLSKSSYEKDLSFIIADEVLGMSISKYISGDKGMFEYVRFDKEKPGILSKLGPFMDDVVAGIVGGVSANMYTRAIAEMDNNNESGE